MLTSDLVRLSLRQIYRNRRRYRGAMIGTPLGIAGLITVLTIGESVESTLGKNLEILGTATIVKAAWDFGRAQRWHYGEYQMEDAEEIERIPGVLAVAPAVWNFENSILYKKKKTKARLFGVGPSFFDVIHLPVAKGRKITDEDVRKLRHVCIIGERVEDKLFAADEPRLGEEIKFAGMSFRVVGLLGASEEREFQETILVPITLARAKLDGMRKINNIYVRSDSWDSVPIVHRRVDRLLKERHPGYESAISVTSFTERIDAIKTIVKVFKFFVFAAISVTLILAALGITNVMLAVVVERTKEIGLRKAVGATEPMIMSQFLCESLSVSLVAAIIGIGVGTAAVQSLTRELGTAPNYQVFFYSLMAAVMIGVLLGVLSGVVPARKASRLDPVDAMRFE